MHRVRHLQQQTQDKGLTADWFKPKKIMSRRIKMNEKFVSAMNEENNWKLTENMASALKSTKNDLVDLFAVIGALRTREEFDIEQLFSKAFYEDKLLATKMSFYARNIRGGLGERRTARVIWGWLAKLYPAIMRKNIGFIPEFGRWDDLYTFVGTEVENEMWEEVRAQWKSDMQALKDDNAVSLLGKWLKSVNTSSSESVKLGKLTAKKLGLTEKQYRKNLSAFRKQIDVVERKMSAGKFTEINYSGVPSKAMNNYRNAFKKHDEEGFASYMEKVETGEEKINSGTLYPYDIVEKIMYEGEFNKVLEEQWKALPNYVEDENNMLVMADVSGSMYGRPIATSVGLAIYFAERNKGVFHNKFMTFSAEPDFVTLKGSTLYEKIHNAVNAHWDMNTDIEKAMRLILNAAVTNKLEQADLPKALIIISDMEFDQCSRVDRATYYQHMSKMFNDAGYELPKIIFWNVEARQDTFHAEMTNGVQFASGQSPSVFGSITSGLDLTAYDFMLEALNDPVYDGIAI